MSDDPLPRPPDSLEPRDLEPEQAAAEPADGEAPPEAVTAAPADGDDGLIAEENEAAAGNVIEGGMVGEEEPAWLVRLRSKIAAEKQERGLSAKPSTGTPPIAVPPPAEGDTEPASPPTPNPSPTEEGGEFYALVLPSSLVGEGAGDGGTGHREDDPPWLRELLAAQSADGTTAEAAPPEEASRQAGRTRDRASTRQRRTTVSRPGTAGSAIRSVVIIMAAAVLSATIFTFWTPADFFSDEAREGLLPVYATLSAGSPPTPVPTPLWLRRIGIVSGHRGPHPSTGRDDPGAVCEDGLTENEVNFNVASRVVALLSGIGYEVDLLDEWDPRLEGYQAALLLSIHTDSCHHFELPGATGFKVAAPSSRNTARPDDERLVDCLSNSYGRITGLPTHPSVTYDMTDYHSFREISPVTPAAIIELGFLYEDRAVLTGQPDTLAQGIVTGLLCFLEAGAPTPLPEVTPWATVLHTPTPLETPNPS